MKVVIDIDEDVFTRLFDNGIEDYTIADGDLFAMANSIRKGTPLPLPKGYGRWLVLSEAKMKEYLMKVDFSCQKWIGEVNLYLATFAIIEADKEDEE